MKPWLQIILICLTSSAFAQTLALPPRATNAPDGDAFAPTLAPLDLPQRDHVIASQILTGNVPDFLRQFQPVTVTNTDNGETNIGTFWVASDYLAVGSDANYFLTPMAPATAQFLADQLECVLPTRKMVNAIYAAADVKLPPSPIPPSPAMTTILAFIQHNLTVRAQRLALTNAHPLGELVAGDQKDVVVSARLNSVTNRIAIYGWHQTNGIPIQPLFLGHVSWWVDYSQCIRLVADTMLVNGEKKTIAEVLADPRLCGLISDEGVITNARYSTNLVVALPPAKTLALPWPKKFSAGTNFGEWTREIRLPDDIRILINAPAPETFFTHKPVLLVFYALPNGNSIEQTIGHALHPGDDWRFDIQHIGAQTRWLRQILTNETLVVVYLEAGGKSWPAWRKVHPDQRIVTVLNELRGIFPTNQEEIVLASHSGGGSLVFGYLNAVENIPTDVKRIAFLDSDYSYDTAKHAAKIKAWLAASPENHLCIVAYQDYLARYNGKPFVSETGGTWGRSRAILADLNAQFPFISRTNGGLETVTTTDRRIEFLLKENSEGKILHTVQVERNGFIQALLEGTFLESRGYEYLGERAYTNWITP